MSENQLSLQGKWARTKEYLPFDVVEHGGSSFISRAPSKGQKPRATGEHWMLLAQRGQRGLEGLMGPAGSKGRRGAPAE